MKDIRKFYVVGAEDKAHARRRDLADGVSTQPGNGVIFLEQATTVTKLEAANRELCAAIHMFFADGDAVAVHALACAASEIYEQHGKADVGPVAGDHMKNDYESSENKLWEILNGSRDFFRHPGKSLADRIVFSDEMNDFVLLAAADHCSALSGPNLPIEVQVYKAWFRALYACGEETVPSADLAPLREAERLSKMIGEWFPNIKTASRYEQKRFGARLTRGVDAGRL